MAGQADRCDPRQADLMPVDTRSRPSPATSAMRSTFLLLATLTLVTGPGDLSAQVVRLQPVDEASQQPAFLEFRTRLLRALLARDTTGLFSAVAPDVINSFGGDGGLREFRSMWRPAEPDSPVWRVLTEILSLGGAFQSDTMFVAPYTSSSFPPEFDGYGHVAITGSGVRVRQQPTTRSPVLTTLTFDVVRRGETDVRLAGWVAVELADGRTGWVAATYVRSPTDHRALFVQRNGRWIMRALVAGD
jgi:hypothetical protein